MENMENTESAGRLQKSLEVLSGDVEKAAGHIMEMNKVIANLNSLEQSQEVRIGVIQLEMQMDNICHDLGFQFNNEEGIIKLSDRTGKVLAEWDRTVK